VGEHLFIASLNAMILVLDARDRLVSAVGGLPPVYDGEVLQPLQVFNYALIHPHDIHADAAGNLYVPQWDSNRTYPVKLTRVS
jgi:hypothetical protein